MKQNTGYPSIDKPQNIGATFLEANPIIPNINIFSAIKAMSTFYRQDVAVDCLKLQATYQKLIDDSVTISRAFKELGIKNGDIITVSMPNFYQAIAVFMAANRIGATLTFLNSFAPTEEIIYYLNLFESSIYINYDKTSLENKEIINKTKVKNVITLEKNNVNSLNINNDYRLTKSETINFNTLGSIAEFQPKKIEKVFNSASDALILFTSGTTGKPKAVVLTNKNIMAAATYLKNSTHVNNTHGEKSLVCVPFTYPYGFSTSTLMSLLCGRQVVLAPDLSKGNIYEYLAKEPNIIFGSPALLELMMNYAPRDFDLSSVKSFISGGDFLTPAMQQSGQQFFENHHAQTIISNGAGNAETVSCGTNSFGIKVKPETVGKILTGSDCMIVDPETYEEKKYNEEGLLLISGKHVFKEYYKNPVQTQEVKVTIKGKEYVNTGMFGKIDQEGYFTLTGRQSRFYIISTLNKVYLDHIQGIINNIEGVRECAVVKVKDDDNLFVNKAYVVLDYDKVPNVDDYNRYIFDKCFGQIPNSKGELQQLKEYEIPSYIEIVETLPRKQGTEKIDYSWLETDADKERVNGAKLTKKI